MKKQTQEFQKLLKSALHEPEENSGNHGVDHELNEHSGEHGIEHVPDTMYVVPLLNERVLYHFFKAVQICADKNGIGEEVNTKTRQLKNRIQHLSNLALLCRFAISGDQQALIQLTYEFDCMIHESRDDGQSLHVHAHQDMELEVSSHEQHSMEGTKKQTDTNLASAIDLFAGASFVSACNQTQLKVYVDVIVSAIENALAFPLFFFKESAVYLGEGDATINPQQANIAINNAARRLLQDNNKCTPALPEALHQQLNKLANMWKEENPVSTFIDLFYKSLIPVESVLPNNLKKGEITKLKLKNNFKYEEKDIVVLFSPHRQAAITNITSDTIEVETPKFSESGPVLVLSKQMLQSISHILSIQLKFQTNYEIEWNYSLFSMIPLYKWAYPITFSESPKVYIIQTPHAASLALFDSKGRRAEGRPIYKGREFTLKYEVSPVGSDSNADLIIDVTGGEIIEQSLPGELKFLPVQDGDGLIRLKWLDFIIELDFPILTLPPEEEEEPLPDKQPSGTWDTPISNALSIVGVHAVVLHTGKVLYFSFDYRCVNNPENVKKYFADPNFGSYQIWDPVTLAASAVQPVGRNVFCAGQCQLADGTIFVAGGQDGAGAVELTGEWDKAFAAGTIPFTFWMPWFETNNGASKDVHSYDPVSDLWTRWPDMRDNRYYPTCQILNNGSAFVAAGLSNLQRFIASGSNWCQNDQFEIYENARLGVGPSPQRRFKSADQYPILRLLPGSSHIFTHIHNTTYLFDVNTGEFVVGAEFIPPLPVGRWTYPMQTGYVLLPQLEGENAKIFVIGGSTHSNFDYNTQSDAPSVRGGFIFEYDALNPLNSKWRQTIGTPTVARLLSDAVLLPDGTVFIVNGIGRGASAGHSSNTVFQADLFDPVSETFTPMATPDLNHPRAYHSTAVLLPDGRVAVAGHTAAYNNPDSGQPASSDDTSIQIFNPPYLFRGPRPQVNELPAFLDYGQGVALSYSGKPIITRLMMMRPCAVTHSQDMDQRAIWISIIREDSETDPGSSIIRFNMPRDKALAPPGFYMLFFINELGVPSEASWIQLGEEGRGRPDEHTGEESESHSTLYLGTYENGIAVESVYDGDIVIEKIDQHCNIDLESRYGSISIIQKCDQHCSVRLKAKTKVNIGEKIDQHCNVTIDCDGDVTIGQKIDGNSSARITTLYGSVTIGQKIDGNSSAFIRTPNGSITIGQKVDGHSVAQLIAPNGIISIIEMVGGNAEVTWQANSFNCPNTAGGSVTRL